MSVSGSSCTSIEKNVIEGIQNELSNSSINKDISENKLDSVGSLIYNYCKDKLDKMHSNKYNISFLDKITEDSETANFQSQVNKMKVWPSFDHIFRAARKDNKWFLRSIPLKGVNRIFIKEKSLIDISKSTYKGLVITSIPDGVIETAVDIIKNSNNTIPELAEYTVRAKENKRIKIEINNDMQK